MEWRCFDGRNYEPKDGAQNVTEESSVFFSGHCNRGRPFDDVRFWFRARLVGDMSGRKERSEGNGVGIRSAKAGKEDEVVEEGEDEEEDKWKPGDDRDAGRRTVYNKNKWFLVEEWRNIDKQEAEL